MSNMKIAVGFGRKTGVHGIVKSIRQILLYNLFNKIFAFCLAHI